MTSLASLCPRPEGCGRSLHDASPLQLEARPSPVGIDLETLRDLAEERAGIMQFDDGISRVRAEAAAFHAHGLPPPGVKP